jgi:hypothetical protein
MDSEMEDRMNREIENALGHEVNTRLVLQHRARVSAAIVLAGILLGLMLHRLGVLQVDIHRDWFGAAVGMGKHFCYVQWVGGGWDSSCS